MKIRKFEDALGQELPLTIFEVELAGVGGAAEVDPFLEDIGMPPPRRGRGGTTAVVGEESFD